MCRFLAYTGAPILLDELMYQPKNSLYRQSFKSREREEPLNGDGFGVGWYAPELSLEPAVFKSVRPAWNERNLQSIAPKIRSNCILGHVRAASTGEVSENNCHPFQYRQFMMMHNGQIGDFHRIERQIRERLSDEMYHWIKGRTDSEHFFALFLDHLANDGSSHGPEALVAAFRITLAEIMDMLREQKLQAPTFLNTVITDGRCMIGTRYVSDARRRPHTLYHSEGSKFECTDGVCRMRQIDHSEHAVLIVSEKLTDVKQDWNAVPPNHFVIVDEALDVTLQPIAM